MEADAKLTQSNRAAVWANRLARSARDQSRENFIAYRARGQELERVVQPKPVDAPDEAYNWPL
jgi:uncharacterized NAD(P)/FAD-binding protein YdhS